MKIKQYLELSVIVSGFFLLIIISILMYPFRDRKKEKEEQEERREKEARYRRLLEPAEQVINEDNLSHEEFEDISNFVWHLMDECSDAMLSDSVKRALKYYAKHRYADGHHLYFHKDKDKDKNNEEDSTI